MSDHVKLFIPGPVEVSARTLAAMGQPMMGHRSKDFQELYAAIQPGLQRLFGTAQPVFLSTSSAWGVMEAAVRNLVRGRVLNCMCGAFSDKWNDVSRRCVKQADALRVEWGKPIPPGALEEKLASGDYDAVTIVHNETSTGVMNPLRELCAAARRFPEVLLVVDTVSSFSAVPIPMDALGIDVLLTGAQKALALPPGLALFSVSERALARAETIADRGYYFDFIEFRENGKKNMTPSTPCIPHIYGLQAQLAAIAAEGLDNRYARHARLNAMVHDWVRRNGFEFFAEEGARSVTLTCVRNNRAIDVPAFQKRLRDRHRIQIDGGYGKIKGQTFRVSNMGDETDDTIATLLRAMDDALVA
jgi:aspartate aminotransferase-like enzyme